MKKNILIISLCFILLIMGIGYSAFSSKLNINSSSSITSNWDVEITSIEKTNTSGNIVEKNKSFTKDTATFNVELEKPGDYVYYKIGVTNKGNVAAIATLGNLTCSNYAFECRAYSNSSTSASIWGITDLTDYRLVIGSNETEYYNIYIKFSSNITSMPENLTNTLTLNLIYKQSDVGITHKDSCYTGKVLKNGTLSITDYDISCGTDVVIPETIDGYTVTEIISGTYDMNKGYIGSFANKGITSVTMPDTITKIGSMSFNGNNLSFLKLSKNLESIGDEAFTSCGLINLELPKKLKSIGHNAFQNNYLTEIDIPDSVTDLAGGSFTNNKATGDNAYIYDKNSDGSTNYEILESYAGSSVDDAIIPESVKTIKSYSFRHVSGNILNIPSTVKKVDFNAFYQSHAQKIILNEGLKTIDANGFFDEIFLTEITIPSTVESIGTNAFARENYNSITSIKTININKKEGSITGAPWGATNATINWIG